MPTFTHNVLDSLDHTDAVRITPAEVRSTRERTFAEIRRLAAIATSTGPGFDPNESIDDLWNSGAIVIVDDTPVYA